MRVHATTTDKHLRPAEENSRIQNTFFWLKVFPEYRDFK